MLDWILLILWFYVGIIHLLSKNQPTKVHYGLVWFTLIALLVEKVAK